MQPGVYLVHKPVGRTSFDRVRDFSREARESGLKNDPVGHGGTLDPFAHGLLLILAGQATRLMELMHPLPKGYDAEVVWGTETDTCDPHGNTVSQAQTDALTPAKLEAALASFVGWHDQVPPATSAKRVNGERAYALAHRGEEVVLAPSRVYLHAAQWLQHELPFRSTLRITCRGGFYVRSLARDLGRALGCGAHLRSLHRTSIGPWDDPGPERRVLIQGEDLIPWCATRRLSLDETRRLGFGQRILKGQVEGPSWPLPEGFPDPDAPIRGVHEGKLIALLRPVEDGFRTVANLRGGL